MSDPELDLTLPAVAASLPSFQAAFDQVCTRAGIAAETRNDLQVVLDEVCSNVFKHAYARTADQHAAMSGTLRLIVRRLPAAIEMTFIDQGQVFDPLSLPAPDLTLPLDERPLGGLGIHLIRQMTDQQSYRHSPAEGNRLSLIKLVA
jgi:serine/threonine-protein kinase RsbW